MIFRPSTLKERKEFYKNEFDTKKVKNWFTKNKIQYPQICALDAGTDTGIILDKKLKGNMLYFPFSELKKKIEKYIPEDIYYDRNVYKAPKKALSKLDFTNWIEQELVFDIDADNISCKHQKEKVCTICLAKAYSWTKKMKKLLHIKFKFKKIKIVYSGRGFHLHVLDKKAFLFNIKERQKLTSYFHNFPIDPWVSKGYISLIRLPFSLNALVSRKVIPLPNIETKSFNEEKTIPNFLKH